MPWTETSPMDKRLRFIHDHRDGYYEMTERCERYGVSRKTGNKRVARSEEDGKRGLTDRSRAPHSWPHKLPVAVAEYRERSLRARRARHAPTSRGTSKPAMGSSVIR